MKDKIIVTLQVVQLFAMVIGLGALISMPGARGEGNAMNGLGEIAIICAGIILLSWGSRLIISKLSKVK